MFQSISMSSGTVLVLMISLLETVTCRRPDDDTWNHYIHDKLSWTHQHPWIFLTIVITLLSPFFVYSYQASVKLNTQIDEIYARTPSLKNINNKKSD